MPNMDRIVVTNPTVAQRIKEMYAEKMRQAELIRQGRGHELLKG